MQIPAILLIAYGSTLPSAQPAFDNILRLAKIRFPQHEIRWALSSKKVCTKLAQNGTQIDSPIEALEKLHSAGFTQVSIQPFFTTEGNEFINLMNSVTQFLDASHPKQELSLGRPLLASENDTQVALETLLTTIAPERQPDETLLFIAHGSSTPNAQEAYEAANDTLNRLDTNSYLACLKDSPTLQTTLEKLKADNRKKILLIPFMSVAGFHAQRDIEGPATTSWANQLTAQGFHCRSLLSGLAQADAIVELWLNHLQDTLPTQN